MKKPNTTEKEIERRLRVAEEKIAGAIIELIERARMKPITRSIILRLFFLYKSVYGFQNTVKLMGKKGDPLETTAPIFTQEQANFLIDIYNDIIDDIHSHFKKKDSYVEKLPKFEKLDEPTINQVAKTLFMMGMYILQAMSYMIRWTEME